MVMGFMLTGCYMVPMALVGPAASGFSTASIVQAGVTTSANYVIKKSTGKTMSEHAYEVISKDILAQTFLPKEKEKLVKRTD
tara:strand:- start:372 stop:617 length:246 start_codon:yes stop_codon:yes gene_type:complete